MIIQCDHCSAKFRMDDSKLANGPVKVRCAKCKEVFVVQPEETPVEIPQPSPPVTAPPEPEKSEFDEFSFDAHAQPSMAVTPPSETEREEFSFDTPSQPSDDFFSQGSADFSFDAEPPVAAGKSDTVEQESSGDFDWQGGAAAASDSAETSSDFDLSSFDASLESTGSAVEPSTAADNDFDFGEVDLTSRDSASVPSQPIAPVTTDDSDFSMDFGEISFSDSTQSAESGADTFSEGGSALSFDFQESAEQAPDSSASEDFLLSFNAGTAHEEASSPLAKKEDAGQSVNFGEFSFGEMDDSAANEAVASPVSSTGSFNPAATTVLGTSPLVPEPEEELPPSSLTSRKKSSSLFPLLVIVGAIILVIAIAGSGVYFFGGSKAFSKVGLGFLVDWYGDKGAEEGSIVLKGVTASYLMNSTAGELFVVRGEALNNFKKPRASVQIKVSLLGAGGASLMTKSAYCGNSISNDQLAKLPMAKLDEIMNNQFGDSLANLGLKPGATIPFVIVVSQVPKEASDYTVVVSGSTVATQ